MKDAISITDVKILLHFAYKDLSDLYLKNIDNPLNEKDYKSLKNAIDTIHTLYSSKWTKEFY